MRFDFCKIFLAIWILPICLQYKIYAQTRLVKANIFYVAVGSSHYNKTFFENVPSANNSAKRFSDLMESFESFGYTLLSSRREKITKTLVLNVIKRLADSSVRRNGSPNILILYFCGHGIADADTKLQFFVPGDVRFDVHDIRDVGRIRSELLSFHDLYPVLKNSNFNHVYLFYDCCYELVARNQAFLWVDQEMRRREETWPDSLKKTLGFHIVDPKDNRSRAVAADNMFNYYTTVYATEPGQSVATVPQPFVSSKKRVGPICRRLLLAERLFNSTNVVIDGQLIKILLERELDSLTAPPTIFVRNHELGEILLRRKK